MALVKKALLTKGGWIQHYWISPKNLPSYEQTGEVFHRFKVLQKLDIAVIALVTVRVDYDKKGNDINFEVNYAQRTFRANLKNKQNELFNKIYNGIFQYFGSGLAGLVNKIEAGFSEGDSPELSAVVRGRRNSELEGLIGTAPESKRFLHG